MAVEIKITDDGTRRALRFVVWDRVHRTLSDGIAEFYDMSRTAVIWDTDPDDEAVRLVVDASSDAQRIMDAKVGEEITLSIPQDALMRGLDECVTYLRKNESFWDADREDRDRYMTTFDAAKCLSRVLTPAEAVA